MRAMCRFWGYLGLLYYRHRPEPWLSPLWGHASHACKVPYRYLAARWPCNRLLGRRPDPEHLSGIPFEKWSPIPPDLIARYGEGNWAEAEYGFVTALYRRRASVWCSGAGDGDDAGMRREGLRGGLQFPDPNLRPFGWAMLLPEGREVVIWGKEWPRRFQFRHPDGFVEQVDL